MIPIAAGMLGFALAFAAWRWGLGDRNWLEGGLAALVAGVLCGVLAEVALRVLARG